jgi:5-methylthioribose kinase
MSGEEEENAAELKIGDGNLNLVFCYKFFTQSLI